MKAIALTAVYLFTWNALAADSPSDLANRVAAACGKPQYLRCMELEKSQCLQTADVVATECTAPLAADKAQGKSDEYLAGKFYGCMAGKHIKMSGNFTVAKLACMKEAK
jgi:hypothetical protein